MSGIEVILVVGGLAYEAFFIPYFIITLSSGNPDPTIIPLLALAIVLGLTAAILTMRDLALRKFESDKSESDYARMKWAILISVTFGIGWIVYILKHALKPRQGGYEG